MNKFSHVDLRVNYLATVLPFYDKLLTELGFTRTFHSANWQVFAEGWGIAKRRLYSNHGRPGA